MRKFLWVVATVALVLTVAAPAMALDFKFGAEYRVRFYEYTNINFDDNNTLFRGNPRGIQIRVRPRFDVSDDNGNIQATLRLEYGDTEFGGGGGANGSPMGTNGPAISLAPRNNRTGNGAGGSIGADGVSIETKWAYIDAAFPFGIPLRVRAGIQPWYLPKGLIVDDDVAGVRAYGTVKPVSYEAFWYRANRGPATTAAPASGTIGQPGFDNTRDNAMDFYGGRLDVAIAPFINPGAYFVYGDNRANCLPNAGAGNTQFAVQPCVSDRVREQWYAGATVTGTIGIVSYDIDFVYGHAKGGPTGSFVPGSINFSTSGASPVTVKGWALDGGIHIPFGPLKFNILGAVATGDKQDGGDSEAFPLGPAPSWSGAGGQYELIGEGGAFDVVTMQQGITNTWMAGLTVEYVPVKPLWIKLAYGYAGFYSNHGNCALAFNVTPGGVVTQNPGTTCFGPIYIGKPSDPIGAANHSAEPGLGHEVHIRADYTIWTGFKVQALAGWLFPTAGDTAGKYIVQLYYNF